MKNLYPMAIPTWKKQIPPSYLLALPKNPPSLIIPGPVMFRRKFLLRTKYEK